MTILQELKTVFTAEDGQYQRTVRGMGRGFNKLERQANRMGRGLKNTFSSGARGLDTLKNGAQRALVPLAALTAGIAALSARAAEMERVLNLSERLDINTDSFQRLTAAAAHFNVEQDALADSLKDLSERIADAAANGGSYEEALNRIGLSGKELIELDMETQFQKVLGAIGKLPTQADKAFVSMELMADAGYELVNMADAGAEKIAALGDEAQSLGNVMSRGNLQSMREMNQAFREMSASVKGLANEFLAELSPAITDTSDSITEAIRGFRQLDAATGNNINVVRLATGDYLSLLEAVEGYINAGDTLNRVQKGNAETTEKLTSASRAYSKETKALTAAMDALRSASASDDMEAMATAGEDAARAINAVVANLQEAFASGNKFQEFTGATSEMGAILKAAGLEIDDFVETYNDMGAGGAEANLNKIIIALQGIAESARDAGQAIPVEYDPDKVFPGLQQSIEQGLDALRSTTDREQALHEERLAMLESMAKKANERFLAFHDAGQLEKAEEATEAQKEIYQAQQDELARHLAVMEDLNQRSAEKNAEIDRKRADSTLSVFGNLFGNLSSLLNTENRKQFEAAKILGIAEATVNTYRAAAQAWADPLLPFWAKPVAAGAAIAGGLAQVQAIQSTQFGGGGGGGGAGGGGGSGTAVAGAAAEGGGDGAAGGQGPATNFNVSLQDRGNYSGSEVRGLLNLIQDQLDDNAQLKLNVE